MPWKASSNVDLKAEFVVRLKAGEKMADLCREYGISRKAGYAVLARFEEGGVAALLPRSRAPKHIPHRTPRDIVDLVIAERRAHPTWGGKKLKVVLEEQLDIKLPAASTIQDLIQRAGLVEKRRRRSRRRNARLSTTLTDAIEPNHVWCADYKGQFRTKDGQYCYPLTMTDHFSRYLLVCDGMHAINDEDAQESSLRAFARHGLPKIIRTDNGSPFASTGLAGLTRLSVLWMRLGIRLERTKPAHPQDNGRHERMHRTLKQETTRPPGSNLLQQQERFDAFVDEYNHARPHEALDMRKPADVYDASPRRLPATMPDLEYPFHDDIEVVRSKGDITFAGRSIHISAALADNEVGLRELDDGRWLVTFADLDLGHIDSSDKTFHPIGPVRGSAT